MDIDCIGKLLNSLSRFCPFNFTLLSGGAPLVSTRNGVEAETCYGESDIKAMAHRISHHQAYQQQIIGDTHGIFGIPIQYDGQTADSLIAHGPFTNGNQEHIKVFLTQLAGIMQSIRKSEKESEEIAQELSQSFEDLYLYTRVAAHLQPLKFSSRMLEKLFHELLETMRVDLVFTKMSTQSEYDVTASRERSDGKKVDDIFIDRLWQKCQIDLPEKDPGYFILNNSTENSGYRNLHPEPFRFLAICLQHNHETYGWLGMVSFNATEIFRRSELDLLRIMTEHIAMVITNTALYRDMERYVINVVSSMVQAIEAKDRYTRGHSERVNGYCMEIADRLQLKEQKREQLLWASILHDVGKIGIPEDILNKPDRLSGSEFDIIKNHPEKGVEILKPIEQLAEAIPGILHHHEQYDGRGYPSGMKGDDIPLISRIIAVADTFDAITTDRAYRKGKRPDQALSIMRQVSGKQLDPDILNTFIEIYQPASKERETVTHGT